MPPMTFASTMSYIGVLALASGLFLILAGFGVIKIEKITVTTGPLTWGFGIILTIIGIFFLLPELQPLIPSQTASEAHADVNLLVLQTDQTDDWIAPFSRPSYMDITEIRIVKVGDDNIRFEMRLNQPVPQTLKEIHFYGWFLDTDLNASTGQKYNDIGSDYNVQITYIPEKGWIGQVFDIEKGGEAIEIKSITVEDKSVSITIPRIAIGSAEKFNWIAIDQDNEPYHSDKVPNDGHIHTEIPIQ
jgi:hypothetical protein